MLPFYYHNNLYQTLARNCNLLGQYISNNEIKHVIDQMIDGNLQLVIGC